MLKFLKFACVCKRVCMCVCEREREKGREGETEIEIFKRQIRGITS